MVLVSPPSFSLEAFAAKPSWEECARVYLIGSWDFSWETALVEEVFWGWWVLWFLGGQAWYYLEPAVVGDREQQGVAGK